MIQGTASSDIGFRGSSVASAAASTGNVSQAPQRPRTGGKTPSIRPRRVASPSSSPPPLPAVVRALPTDDDSKLIRSYPSPSPMVPDFVDVPNQVANVEFLTRVADAVARGSKRSRDSSDDPSPQVPKSRRAGDVSDDATAASYYSETKVEPNPLEWPLHVDASGDVAGDSVSLESMATLLKHGKKLLEITEELIGMPVFTGFYDGPGNISFRITHQVAFGSADCPVNEVDPLARASVFRRPRPYHEKKLTRVLIAWQLLRDLSMKHLQTHIRSTVLGPVRSMYVALTPLLHYARLPPTDASHVSVSHRVLETAARMTAAVTAHSVICCIPLCLDLEDPKGEHECLVTLEHIDDFAAMCATLSAQPMRGLRHPLSRFLKTNLMAMLDRVSATIFELGLLLDARRLHPHITNNCTALFEAVELAKKASCSFAAAVNGAWYSPQIFAASSRICCEQVRKGITKIHDFLDTLITADNKVHFLYRLGRPGLLTRRVSIGLQAMAMSCAVLAFLVTMPPPSATLRGVTEPSEAAAASAPAPVCRRIVRFETESDSDSDSDSDSELDVEVDENDNTKNNSANSTATTGDSDQEDSSAPTPAPTPAPDDYKDVLDQSEDQGSAAAAPEPKLQPEPEPESEPETKMQPKPARVRVRNCPDVFARKDVFVIRSVHAKAPRHGQTCRSLEKWCMQWITHNRANAVPVGDHLEEEVANTDKLTNLELQRERDLVTATNACLRKHHGKPGMIPYYAVKEIVDACVCDGKLFLHVKWMTPAGIADLVAGEEFPMQTWSDVAVVFRNPANDQVVADYINALPSHE